MVLEGQSAVKASLIICSRNRQKKLRRCLEAIDFDEMRRWGCELIVVENASQDGTIQMLRELAREKRSEEVSVLRETRVGKSYALNAGVRASRGEVLAFTDDDCYLGEGYFQTLVASFARRGIDYCGGRICRFDEEDAFYACYEHETRYDIPPGEFVPAGRIQGANMAFHRRVFERIGGFDTVFGPGTRFRCDDIEFAARAALAGFRGAYVPELTVYHHHGRKPGAELEQLMRANDLARGAYYAKFIIRGHFEYLKGWIRATRESGGLHDWRTELKGAVQYLLVSGGRQQVAL